MLARPHRLPRVHFVRATWIAAIVALSAAVFFVLARHGANESDVAQSALAPDIEAEAPHSARTASDAALDSAAPEPSPAPATVGPAPAEARKALTAARAQPESTIVVGFAVVEVADSRPINASGASVSFVVTRGGERWSGRRLSHGQRSIDASVAFGHARLDLWPAADKFLYIELDPATPRGVQLAFEVELAMNAQTERAEALHRGSFRGEGSLTLSGAPYQWLPDVPSRQISPLAAGMVVAGPHVELDGAHVEVRELATPFVDATGPLDAEVLAQGPVILSGGVASAPVLADRTFSVPGPSRPTLAYIQLCVVLADGRKLAPTHSEAFRGDIVLHVEATRTAQGRLLFRGAPATGLARVHAEHGGGQIGHVNLERDGTFSLSGLPYEAFDVVIESGRPGGELARFPLASLTRDTGTSTLDLGVIDVAGHAAVMELELVDRNGAPAPAQLRWSGRGGSGNASLRAAAVHTLLMPAVVQFDMELVTLSPAAPIALAAKSGRVRIVVGE